MEEGFVFGGVPQSPNQCIKFIPADGPPPDVLFSASLRKGRRLCRR